MLIRNRKLLRAFPTELKHDAVKVIKMINQTNKLDFSNCFEVNFRGSKLSIPERIYSNELSLSQYNSLTDRQQVVLNCLFTRHHDGFIREENLKKIINQCKEYNWIIPYIIRLTGEYVIEILQVIKDNLDNIDKAIITDFKAENAKFYNTIESRVISYWNYYYRRKYPVKTDYVGYEIIKYFNA
ncbi:hypothetical protein ACQKM9_04920 [Viridibacillus sp. NPDC093762]|uniref:hypothetical protein n=1 Tax=Viridibacillus sp. NPDC093762 TaxID=3390720 RepID=UPI003D03E00C